MRSFFSSYLSRKCDVEDKYDMDFVSAPFIRKGVIYENQHYGIANAILCHWRLETIRFYVIHKLAYHYVNKNYKEFGVRYSCSVEEIKKQINSMEYNIKKDIEYRINEAEKEIIFKKELSVENFYLGTKSVCFDLSCFVNMISILKFDKLRDTYWLIERDIQIESENYKVTYGRFRTKDDMSIVKKRYDCYIEEISEEFEDKSDNRKIEPYTRMPPECITSNTQLITF